MVLFDTKRDQTGCDASEEGGGPKDHLGVLGEIAGEFHGLLVRGRFCFSRASFRSISCWDFSANALAEALSDEGFTTRNVFFEANWGKLYRKHFLDTERILLRDGFRRRRNRDHPPLVVL